jgi:formamidopyrimidine-DNA glycosylase
MPELPEVETVRRGLQPALEGARFDHVLARRPDLRWPLLKDFVQRLEGKTVEGLGRRAKYLLADLSSGEVLLMHLGMSGSFRVFHDGRKRKPGRFHHERTEHLAHDHIVFAMSSGATVTFNDPRRFGFMKLVPRAKLEQEPLLRSLGPEPLGNAFDAAMLAQACRGKKTSLKAALSDQRVVAGLGNIYVCEALHRVGRGCRPSERRRRSRRDRARPTTMPSAWSQPSARCSRMRSKPAARRCAITAAPMVNLAISSIASVSMTARDNGA